MEDHSFVQMSNGTIKEVDPVDDTMSLIEKKRSFRPNSYAETLHHQRYDFSPRDIKETRDNDEVTMYME